MSLRTKLVLAFVACTTVASFAVGLLSLRTASTQFNAAVDESLEDAVVPLLAPGPEDRDGGRLPMRAGLRFAGDIQMQVLQADGDVRAAPGATELPADTGDLVVAATEAPGVERYRTSELDGEPIRLLTVSIGDARGAVQAARSLTETEEVLASLRNRILLTTALVALVAGLLGWLLARQITNRLVAVTTAAEKVAGTGSLDVSVPVEGSDEAGRLGVAFNEMMGALAASKESQQRLVQDAGHELRTPMTSLRTNLFALRRFDDLAPAERERVLGDLEGETEELSRLIDEVVEVATDSRDDEPVAEVDLVAVASRVAERAAARSGRAVLVSGGPSTVVARPGGVRRAVSNLVENALKFDRSDGPIDVRVDGGSVVVADRGPGFAAEDLPHVFDRFYRSVDARSEPGSGLGLSIVAAVAAAHDGEVLARNREGGGAEVGIRFPTP